MSGDYEKQLWQAEQEARDRAMERDREKQAKRRERSARNARRKIERLHKKLVEEGEISDFENEFGEGVMERLDKFGSAFHDLEKGRPGDALSFAQKRVVAAMNKKVKTLKKKAISDSNPENNESSSYSSWKNKKRSGFKRPKSKFTPRVRHIEDDFVDSNETSQTNIKPTAPKKPPATKPFLRLVISDQDETQSQQKTRLEKTKRAI